MPAARGGVRASVVHRPRAGRGTPAVGKQGAGGGQAERRRWAGGAPAVGRQGADCARARGEWASRSRGRASAVRRTGRRKAGEYGVSGRPKLRLAVTVKPWKFIQSDPKPGHCQGITRHSHN